MKIIVNGDEHEISDDKVSLTYEEVVKLAEHKPKYNPSVTAKLLDGSGSILSPGRKVGLFEGMIFNVAYTGNA